MNPDQEKTVAAAKASDLGDVVNVLMVITHGLVAVLDKQGVITKLGFADWLNNTALAVEGMEHPGAADRQDTVILRHLADVIKGGLEKPTPWQPRIIPGGKSTD